MKTARSRKGCIDNPNLTYQAEPREVKLRKTIYRDWERKDGVQPEFDIRTDRFEVAIDAIDKINQSTANQIAKNKGQTETVKDFGTEVKTDPEKS